MSVKSSQSARIHGRKSETVSSDIWNVQIVTINTVVKKTNTK